MIPSFKTYLKESVWMDIHKRSNNDVDRKEEDIDLLDPAGLEAYIMNKFDVDSKHSNELKYYDDTGVLYVPILSYLKETKPHKVISIDTIFYDYAENVIYIHHDSYKPLINLLKSRFLVKIYDRFYLSIEPAEEDRGLSNRFFLEIIDYVNNELKNDKEINLILKNKGIDESVWMNIHKRSNNELDRKEEDINLLNIDEFNNYLNSLYDGNIKISYNEQSKVEGLVISFARSKNHNPGVFSNWPVSLVYYTDRGMLSFSNKKFDDLCPHLYHELMPIFNIETDKEGFKFIVPDGNKKVDNKFVLYVLETIIEHLDPNEEEITIFKK